MNIHEYQGKAILKSFGVRVQEGIVADNVEQAVEAAKKLKEDLGSAWVVVKAQIHAGGRGKGGGVKLAKNLDEVKEKAGNILMPSKLEAIFLFLFILTPTSRTFELVYSE